MARPKVPLTPDDIKKIQTMAGLGMNLHQIAAVLDMGHATLERRLKDTPGGSEAIEKGRALGISNVAKTAYALAVSGKVPAMTMFYLKCRAHWKETTVVETPDLNKVRVNINMPSNGRDLAKPKK